jgi:hypothetical protein
LISFGQLESRVRTLYEAESSVRWPQEDFLDAANDGLDDLSETGFYERFVPIPLKGGQTYYDLRGFVPKGIIRVNFVYNVNEQIWLTPSDFRDLNTPRWETVTDSPQRYLIRGLYWLGLYPRPNGDTNTIRTFYSGLAPHFKDGDSVLSDLPDDLIEALEDYSLYDLSIKDRRYKESLEHWTSYIKRKKKLEDQVKRRIVTARLGRLGRNVGRFGQYV